MLSDLDPIGSSMPSNAGNNIKSSWKVEYAFTYHPEKNLSFYIQPTIFSTDYYNLASAAIDSQQAVALQIGSHYSF